MQKYLISAFVVMVLTSFNIKGSSPKPSRYIEIVNSSHEDAMLGFGYHFINQIVFTDNFTIEGGTSKRIQTDSLLPGVYYIEFGQSELFPFYWSDHDTGSLTLTYSGRVEQVYMPNHSRFYHEINAHSDDKDFIAAIKDSITDALLLDYMRALGSSPTIKQEQLDEFVNEKESGFEIQIAYYQKHYFDSVNFEQTRLAYTPVLFNKINTYLDKIIKHDYDNILSAIDLLMDQIPENSSLYQFTLQFLFLKYQKEISNPDENFVFRSLLENYYLNNKATWPDNGMRLSTQKKFLTMNQVSVGQVAPDLVLLHSNNSEIHLHQLKNQKPTILYFYDYDCSACKKAADRLTRLFSDNQLAAYQLLSICVGEETLRWKGYLRQQHLPDRAIHLFDNSTNQKAGLYYKLATIPTIFILNEHYIVQSIYHSVSELKNSISLESESKDLTN